MEHWTLARVGLSALPGRGRPSAVRTGGVLVVAGALFGLAMGAYAGGGWPRPLQMAFSAIKVPLLLGVTYVLCVPSFVVVSALLGLRADTAKALRAILSAQAVLALALAGMAPYTLVWYASSTGHDIAVLFNAMLFAIATVCAQIVLRASYRPLIARDPRHRIALWFWLILYAFVGIQMAWVLRPFVGSPGLETRFFRENSWSNAYVWVARAILRTF